MEKEKIIEKIKSILHGEKLIYVTLSGSMLYGTNSENSDIDIKFIFLPKIEDLVLCNAPKHYTMLSKKEKESKNTSEDIDITGYSLQYFMNLLSMGETNALDVFFSYTNKNAIIFKDNLFDELITHKDLFITKHLDAYLSYALHQSVKYSLKGEKINNFTTLHENLTKYVDKKNDQGNHLTIEDVLEKEFKIFSSNKKIISPPVDYLKGNNVIGKRAKLDLPVFGEHVYLIYADNKEIFLSVSDLRLCLSDSIPTALRKIGNSLSSYGKRAQNAAEDNGADYKALSHAIRVLMQTEELLTSGEIKFPLQQAEYLKNIKYKKTNLTYDEIIDKIINQIDFIKKNLLEKSSLRDNADTLWINNFILRSYEKNGDIKL